MKLLYRIFYRGFLKYHQNECKPREELVYAFTDANGKKYHTFPAKDQIPMIRYNRLLKNMAYWEMKLGKETFDTIKYAITDALRLSLTTQDQKEREKAVTSAVMLLHEIDRRDELCVPPSIFLNFCAIFAIREDENPVKLNEQIHEEKMLQFATELNNGHDFFFELPNLQKYLNLSRQSSVELRVLFAKSQKREEMIQNLIHNYLFARLRGISKPNIET